MRDLDTLQNMNMIIENLANGINFFTGEIASDTDIVNDVRIARVLFKTTEILKELISQQKPTKSKKISKPMFVYNQELIKNVEINPRPISLSEISRNIVVAYNNECKLTYKIIAELLYREGVLIDNTEDTPKLKASDNAKQYGIWSEIVHRSNGDRLQTFYNEEGQRFVLGILKKYF